MNNAIVGNKYIVKGFHQNSYRFDDSQHWIGKVVECLYSDGKGVSDGDPDNTCACKIKNVETGEEIYSCAVYLEEYKEMKNLITEPIDFTGCIPEVAEALKRGLKVKILPEDSDLKNAKIIGYDQEFDAYVIEHDEGHTSLGSCFFTPLYEKQTETRVKKASEIVKWMEDNGYEVGDTGGWYRKNYPTFNNRMFQYCGAAKPSEWNWLPEWLEEVEV